VLVFQEKGVLEVAKVRLDKIMSDLKNLQNAKILKTTDTSDLINLSMKSLANAQLYNSNAESIISKSIKKDLLDIASSTPLSASSTPALETATTSIENTDQTATSSLLEKLNASGSATSTDSIATATSTLQKINTIEEDKAQILIEKSLKEIKNAYNNFISISNLVSKKLKLK
jgi:hypothetical protein